MCTTPRARNPGLHRPRCLRHSGLFFLAAQVPVNSNTVPRRHGRITHQPDDAPYGGRGPDLPSNPPLSHGSSKFEVDDRKTRRLRALHKWACLSVQSAALRDSVPPRPLCGPPTRSVAAVGAPAQELSSHHVCPLPPSRRLTTDTRLAASRSRAT